MSKVTEVHFEGKIAQKVIVAREGRVLLVQDPRENRSIWELPGGRINLDEDPIVAIQREFREEMGVDIEIGQVVHMEQFLQGSEGKRAFVIVYEGCLKSDNFDIAADEVSEVSWFSEQEIGSLELFPEYKRAIEKYFKQKQT